MKAGTLSVLSSSIPTTKPSHSVSVCGMKSYTSVILFSAKKK